MQRSIVYLFSDGSWDYGYSYSVKTHGHRGYYHEVVIGEGWNHKDITQMLKEYYNENSDILFKAVC